MKTHLTLTMRSYGTETDAEVGPTSMASDRVLQCRCEAKMSTRSKYRLGGWGVNRDDR
jgi:hypothetical protein